MYVQWHLHCLKMLQLLLSLVLPAFIEEAFLVLRADFTWEIPQTGKARDFLGSGSNSFP